MEKDTVQLLVELNKKFAELSIDMKNIKEDVSDLKRAFREMVEIEKRQQRIEDEYKRIINCCNEIQDLKELNNKLTNRIDKAETELNRIKSSMERQSDRFWKVALSILEKLLFWLILIAIALRDKVL
jgi:predicted  nucleic acid-binding Zn-ribbon protein